MTLRRTTLTLLLGGVVCFASACGSDTKGAAPVTTTSAAASAAATTAPKLTGVSAAGISDDRCKANRAAGTLTYLSGFDLAASAGIVEVVVAKQKGYFDKLCLDVDVKASFSTANYALIGANKAQFASAGSYTEMLANQKDGAQFVAVVNDGKVGVDALLVRPNSGINSPADLKGKVIGVKGALPPSEVALLAKYGLRQGKDYREVTLQGFDPRQHWAQPIDALPVYKSNEPGQLDAANIPYVMFDPVKEGIPGSFGVIYTNNKFHAEHPTAVQDFVRAAMRGMEDAIAAPDEAVALCFKQITAGGNKNFLSEAGEKYRWSKEAKLVTDFTPPGEGVGLFHRADLDKLISSYLDAGVFGDRPKIDGTYDADSIAGIYGPDAKVIFPA